MALQPRPAWSLPMARQAAPAPIPAARPTAPAAPAPRPSIVGPAFPIQPQEPNPPPPPADASPHSTDAPPPSSPASAAAPPRSPVAPPAPTAALPRSPVAAPPRSPVAPPAPTAAPQRSPVAPPAPAPSTPRSPIAPPPLANISPSASKSPSIKASNSLPTSPAPKVSPTTNVLSPSIPSSPKTQTLGPSSSVPTSPVPKPIATATRIGLVPGQAATPASSPKIGKPLETTQFPSPKTKVASRPPSPLTLPPSQINTESAHETMIPSKVEQKLVLAQDTIGDPKVMLNTHDDEIASREKRVLKKDRSANKKLSDSEEYSGSVITLAGENKGAIMELSPTPKNHYSAGNPQSLYKTISIKEGTDGEQLSIDKSELRRYRDKLNKVKATPTTAIMNRNFQGVNNAILYDCTFTHQDPGIHLSLTGNGTVSNGIHLTDHQS